MSSYSLSSFWILFQHPAESEYSASIRLKIFFKKRKEKQFSVAYVTTELMLFAFYWLGSHPSRSK